jgi:hypothetical protein
MTGQRRKKGGGLSKGALIAIVGGGAAAGVGVAAKGKGGSQRLSAVDIADVHRADQRADHVQVSHMRTRRDVDGDVIDAARHAADGAVTGFGGANVSTSVVAVNSFCSPTSPQPGSIPQWAHCNRARSQETRAGWYSAGGRSSPIPRPVPKTDDWSFSGTLAADVVTGTLDWSVSYAGTEGGGGGLGTTRFNVTAR